MSHQEGSELDRDLVIGVPEDQEIEITLKDRLTWDGRLDSSGVRVWVCAGAVTLTGYVPTQQEKELAGEIAAEVRGVTDVANDLKVTGGVSC